MARTMTLSDMQQYVWSYLDVDSTDLPVTLLQQWAQEGYDKCFRYTREWPFLESTFTLNTVQGQQKYAIDGTDIPLLEEIYAIQGPMWELQFIDQTAIEAYFTPAFVIEGQPERYSFWGGNLYLWPIPSSVYALNIRGYLAPTDWIGKGIGASPDLPSEFHMAIATWMMSQGWAQQTDMDMAQFHEQRFYDKLDELVRRFVTTPAPQGLILNGGKVTRELPPRMRYPWEGLNSVGPYS